MQWMNIPYSLLTPEQKATAIIALMDYMDFWEIETFDYEFYGDDFRLIFSRTVH